MRCIFFSLLLTIPVFTNAQDDFMHVDDCKANLEADSSMVQLFDSSKIIIASFGDVNDDKMRAVYEKYGNSVLDDNSRGEVMLVSLHKLMGKIVENDMLNEELLLEHKLLTEPHKEQLKNIFLQYRGDSDRGSTVFCFIPRNAIFFLDENDRIKAYLSVCFECTRSHFYTRLSSEFAKRCMSIHVPLQKFMEAQGIQFGVTRSR